MRRACFCFSLMLILVCVVQAKKRDKDPTAGFPRLLLSARFVYVTSFTGGEFNISTDPQDRAAIHAVQDALHEWGRYTLVYRPEEADLILNVRAGRELEAGGGVQVGSAPPFPGTGGTGGIADASIGPADDYFEVLMPIATERLDLSRATILWRRALHKGLAKGAPLIQEFRKEAEAAAVHDGESKKKP